MITRRTFLAAGSGAVALGTAAVVVGVQVAHRPLPLELDALRGLVGSRFRDSQTGATVQLMALGGPDGVARHDAFTVNFAADDTAELPGAIRTLVHDDRALTLYLGPVGADGRTLEAVVDRTV